MEARHVAHAVAVRGGEVVGSAGDPQLVTHFRSSAKPIQALPLVRVRPDLDDAEIAIACASHLARPEQLDAVRSLLAKAPGDRGRSRVRAGADAARAQLLGKARRPARALPCHGVADRGLSAARAPVPAGAPRRDRSRRRGRSGRRCRPPRTAAASRRSRSRSSGWHTPSRGSPSSKAHRGSSPRCARIPISSAGRRRRTPCSCGRSPAGLRRAAPKGSSAPSPPTASASRSRSRTAASGRYGLRQPKFLSSLGVDAGELGHRPGRELARRGRRRAPRNLRTRVRPSSCPSWTNRRRIVANVEIGPMRNRPSRIRMRRLVAEPVRRRKSRLAR